MLFDPEETDIKFFMQRIKIVAAQEGSQLILDVLPFCLKGRALEWHMELDEDVHVELALIHCRLVLIPGARIPGRSHRTEAGGGPAPVLIRHI